MGYYGPKDQGFLRKDNPRKYRRLLSVILIRKRDEYKKSKELRLLSKFLVYSFADSLNTYFYFSSNEIKLRFGLKNLDLE